MKFCQEAAAIPARTSKEAPQCGASLLAEEQKLVLAGIDLM